MEEHVVHGRGGTVAMTNANRATHSLRSPNYECVLQSVSSVERHEW